MSRSREKGKYAKLEQAYEQAMLQQQADQQGENENWVRDWVEEGRRQGKGIFWFEELAHERQKVESLQQELEHRKQVEIRNEAIKDLIEMGGLVFVRKAYIYGLVDPRDNLIYYVGATRDLTARYATHLTEKVRDKGAWVEGLKVVGLRPNLILLEEIVSGRESDLFKAESLWIEACLGAGMPLTNRESKARKQGCYSP